MSTIPTPPAPSSDDIARMYHAHNDGEWEGESPEQLLCRWQNCKHAEVHPDGSLYIEGPQTGHYLDDDSAAKFAAWCRSEGCDW